MTPATTLNHAQPASVPSSPDSPLRDSRFAPSCDSRLAPLDPDTESQILDLFIAGQMELSTIAAMNDITFTQLIDFLESPRIVARLDAIQRLCERRAALMAAEARCVALARLRTIADHQPEPRFTPPKLFPRELETTRKAAAQLLRVPPSGRDTEVHRTPADPRPQHVPPTSNSAVGPSDVRDLLALRAALNNSHSLPRRQGSAGFPAPLDRPDKARLAGSAGEFPGVEPPRSDLTSEKPSHPNNNGGAPGRAPPPCSQSISAGLLSARPTSRSRSS